MRKRNVKKAILSILLGTVALFCAACTSSEPTSSSDAATTNTVYVLNQPVLELEIGETFPLQVLASDNSSAPAEFISGDETIASVTTTGEVLGIAVGKTEITVNVNGKALKCYVSVGITMQAVPEFVLEGMQSSDGKYALTLFKGTEYDVTPVLKAGGETLNVTITATSAAPTSVSVENNVIKANAVAESVAVTFSCAYEGVAYTLVCEVTVEEVAQ